MPPMKLIVQIPAFNERETIGEVIDHIPRHIPGVDSVEVLIIDDGCTDDTVSIALDHGADHVVRHTGNKGLARAYQTGIDAALRLGADIVVNTDGDHQYPGAEIPRLVQPILDGQAEIVIGNRQIHTIDDFSTLKKLLQYIGSGVVRWASGTDITDTVSGFRALSREAALRTFVTSDFSYTVENLIQAGKKRLTLANVTISTNPATRPSKLARSNWQFIKRQAAIIVRTYATYEPLRTFSYIATPFLAIGALLLARAFYVFLARRLLENYLASNDQALVGGSVLFIVGFVILLVGLLADRIGGLRRVEEEVLYRLRKQEIADEAWRRSINARMTRLEQQIEVAPLEREQ